MKYTPLGAKGYTAWVDDRHDELEGGVLEITGFPTLKASHGDKGHAELLKAIEVEISKYLKLCEMLGWHPVKRDPDAAAIHHLMARHESNAVQTAVVALQVLANECESFVGAEAASRLAIAIAGNRLKLES